MLDILNLLCYADLIAGVLHADRALATGCSDASGHAWADGMSDLPGNKASGGDVNAPRSHQARRDCEAGLSPGGIPGGIRRDKFTRDNRNYLFF